MALSYESELLRLKAVDEWAQKQDDLPQHLWSNEKLKAEAWSQRAQERQGMIMDSSAAMLQALYGVRKS